MWIPAQFFPWDWDHSDIALWVWSVLLLNTRWYLIDMKGRVVFFYILMFPGIDLAYTQTCAQTFPLKFSLKCRWSTCTNNFSKSTHTHTHTQAFTHIFCFPQLFSHFYSATYSLQSKSFPSNICAYSYFHTNGKNVLKPAEALVATVIIRLAANAQQLTQHH